MPATMNIHGAKGKNASAALTKRRFVKLDTAAADKETVKQCDTAGEASFGVALFSVSAAEILRGKGASVITEGRAVLEAAAAIPVGSPVSTDNVGRAKVAVATEFILGFCDEPSAGIGLVCSVQLSNGAGKMS